MKIRRIIGMVLCVVILFSVSVSVFSSYEGYYYRFFFSEDFNGGLSGWYPTVMMSRGFTYSPDGGIVGGPDAKYIISDEICGHGSVYCGCPHNSYAVYDMTVTLFAVDDSARTGDRFINLIYDNYNPMYQKGENKVMMSFAYDFQDDCFRFSKGMNNADPEDQIMPPVYMKICEDGTEYYTLGMTVERDRIRCFYNDELIFDYTDTEEKYLIGHGMLAPLILWNEGNYVHITNAATAYPGHLLEPSYIIGDSTGDGKINLTDSSRIMKYIAKWKDIDINIGAADANRDGKINLSDVSHMLKYIAG